MELAASLVSEFNPPKKVTLVHDDISLIPQLKYLPFLLYWLHHLVILTLVPMWMITFDLGLFSEVSH